MIILNKRVDFLSVDYTWELTLICHVKRKQYILMATYGQTKVPHRYVINLQHRESLTGCNGRSRSIVIVYQESVAVVMIIQTRVIGPRESE